MHATETLVIDVRLHCTVCNNSKLPETRANVWKNGKLRLCLVGDHVILSLCIAMCPRKLKTYSNATTNDDGIPLAHGTSAVLINDDHTELKIASFCHIVRLYSFNNTNLQQETSLIGTKVLSFKTSLGLQRQDACANYVLLR